MNPYESPKTEPLQLDKPVEARLAYHHPVWQRVLALSVPFFAGVLSLMGIESLVSEQPYWAILHFGIAASSLMVAWRWTR